MTNNIKNNIDNLNYLFTSPIKFFINKVWENDIINDNENGLNRLNNRFSERLEYVLNLNNNQSYSGKYFDDLFNNQYYGLLGLSKLKKAPFIDDTTKDKYYLMHTYQTGSTLLLEQDRNTINKLESNSLYHYVLDVKGTQLYPLIGDDQSSTISYQIDFLDKKYRTLDPQINDPYSSTDSLKFYSDEIIKNTENISVIAKEKYTIIDYYNHGQIYEIILRKKMNLKNRYQYSNTNLTVYYNENKINILSYDSSTNKLQLSGQVIDIAKSDYIKIVQSCGIAKYQVTSYNITILVLSQTITDFYFIDGIADIVYIEINNNIYLLEYNTIGEYYYIDQDINNGTDTKDTYHHLNKVYTIFKFNQIDTTKTNYITALTEYSADIVLNRQIGEYYYYIQSDENLPISFEHSNVTLKKVEYLSSTKLGIKYTGIIDNIKTQPLTHIYRLRESIDYRINSITKQEKYLYNIKNVIGLESDDKTNISIIIGPYDSPIYSTQVYSIDSSLIKFFILNSSFISTDILNSKNILINKSYDVTSNILTYEEVNPPTNAKLTFTITEPATFSHTPVSRTSIVYSYTADLKLKNDTNTYKFQDFSFSTSDNIITITLVYNDNSIGLSPSNSFSITDIDSFVLYQNIKTNNYNLTSAVNRSTTIVRVDIPKYTYNQESFIQSLKYTYNLIVNGNLDEPISITDITINDDSMDIQLDSYFIYDNDALTLQEKLTSFDITKETYNSLYQIKTINDMTNLNKGTTFIPQVKILDKNMGEFTTKHEYDFTFSQSINTTINFNDYIYLFHNNKLLKATIVLISKEQVSTEYTYKIKITLDDTLLGNLTTPIPFYTLDFTFTKSVIVTESNLLYNTTVFVEDVKSDAKTINVLGEGDSLDDYDFSKNITSNNVILKFKYTNVNLVNNSYNNVGFNKVPDITETTETTTTTTSNPEWVDEMQLLLFKSIEFIIDDNIIEKHDYETYKIINSFYETIYSEQDFNKLIELKTDTSTNDTYFYLPLKLFFTKKYSDYLPICSMRNSNVKIRFNINKLSELLVTTGNFTKLVKPIIDLYYTTVTLSKDQVDKVKQYNLYLAQVSYKYSSYLLNNLIESNHLNLYQLVKDLFLIIKEKDTTSITSTIRDLWYEEYNTNYTIYNNLKSTNQTDEIPDYSIFVLADYEMSSNSNRVTLFKSNNILSKQDIMFIIYLDEKYLKYINEDLNNWSNKFSQKISLLTLYFEKIYKNTTLESEEDIINTINIKLNGTNLLPTQSGKYFTNLLSNIKGYRLQNGYYIYSFNYNSLDKQPNGHLNFKKIDDLQIYTKLNRISSNTKLQIYTKEYRIIEFKNNRGKLIA